MQDTDTDCIICDGNPADTTLTDQMLDRQGDLYGRYPLKVALNGGFASKENLSSDTSKNIKEGCRSPWVYKRLRRFQAGVEPGISWLKRCFGLCRCIWKGLQSSKGYVWTSIVSANLLTLARQQMA